MGRQPGEVSRRWPRCTAASAGTARGACTSTLAALARPCLQLPRTAAEPATAMGIQMHPSHAGVVRGDACDGAAALGTPAGGKFEDRCAHPLVKGGLASVTTAGLHGGWCRDSPRPRLSDFLTLAAAAACHMSHALTL